MKNSVDAVLQTALVRATKIVGRSKILNTLNNLSGDVYTGPDTLTVIVNAGVHHLSEENLRGEVFVASEGTLDLSSSRSVHNEFERILFRTAKKLKSRDWRRVYIVPFGPTALSMQIKLLVYRICSLESIDVMNIVGKQRIDLKLDLRKLIVDCDTVESTVKRS